MNQDLFHSVEIKNALRPQTINSNTTTAGAIIDLQGFESCTFVMESGTLTDGAYTPLIQEGDASNLSDAASVADADLLGTEAGAAFGTADDSARSKIGYIGSKRYVRLSVVSTGTSSGGVLGATVVLGHARHLPKSTQLV